MNAMTGHKRRSKISELYKTGLEIFRNISETQGKYVRSKYVSGHISEIWNAKYKTSRLALHTPAENRLLLSFGCAVPRQSYQCLPLLSQGELPKHM